MKKAIICDIDGVLLDSTQPIAIREKAIQDGISEENSWNYFYDNLDKCVKNEWCYQLLEDLAHRYVILFITGRDEECMLKTQEFLKFNVPMESYLYMRPQGNLDKDTDVKRQHLDKLTKQYDIVFAIDDRIDNCLMYKEFGIQPLNVML